MPKRKTQEEYERDIKEKAPHVQVRGIYVNNRTPIEHYCLKHNVSWDISPFNFLQHPNGCKECQQEIFDKFIDSRRKTNEQFLKEVEALGTGIIPKGEYLGNREIMPFECKYGHVWDSTPHDVLEGYGCPYCAGQKVLIGFNDLWTTDPEMASMLTDPSIGYEITRGSKRIVGWTCPYCSSQKQSSPKQVSTYGLACPNCSDGISYPNRLMYNILTQFNINFKNEVSKATQGFEWVGKYKYDFYFEVNGNMNFIEMDGGFHYGDYFLSYEEVHDTDKIKDSLAIEHGINMIRIDCNYTLMSRRFEYIKQSILNSKLNQILDLNSVNWEKCNKDALKSLYMEAAKQYDSGMSIREIANNLGVSYSSVYTWIKTLGEKGLCSYKPVLGRTKKNKI